MSIIEEALRDAEAESQKERMEADGYEVLADRLPEGGRGGAGRWFPVRTALVAVACLLAVGAGWWAYSQVGDGALQRGLALVQEVSPLGGDGGGSGTSVSRAGAGSGAPGPPNAGRTGGDATGAGAVDSVRLGTDSPSVPETSDAGRASTGGAERRAPGRESPSRAGETAVAPDPAEDEAAGAETGGRVAAAPFDGPEASVPAPPDSAGRSESPDGSSAERDDPVEPDERDRGAADEDRTTGGGGVESVPDEETPDAASPPERAPSEDETGGRDTGEAVPDTAAAPTSPDTAAAGPALPDTSGPGARPDGAPDVGTASESDRERARRLFREAASLAEAGDTEGAVARYRKAIEADSTFASAYSNLGVVLTGEERYREAAKVLRAGMRKTDGRPGLAVNLAINHLEAGEPERAVDALRGVIAGGGAPVEAYLNLGLAYRQMDELGAAETALRTALERGGGHPMAHYNLARVLEAEGRVAEAITHYSKFLESEAGSHQLRVRVQAHVERLRTTLP